MNDLDTLAAFCGLSDKFADLVFRRLDEIPIQVIACFLRVDRQGIDLGFHQILEEMSPVGRFGGEATLVTRHFHERTRIVDVCVCDGHALHRV